MAISIDDVSACFGKPQSFHLEASANGAMQCGLTSEALPPTS